MLKCLSRIFRAPFTSLSALYSHLGHSKVLLAIIVDTNSVMVSCPDNYLPWSRGSADAKPCVPEIADLEVTQDNASVSKLVMPDYLNTPQGPLWKCSTYGLRVDDGTGLGTGGCDKDVVNPGLTTDAGGYPNFADYAGMYNDQYRLNCQAWGEGAGHQFIALAEPKQLCNYQVNNQHCGSAEYNCACDGSWFADDDLPNTGGPQIVFRGQPALRCSYNNAQTWDPEKIDAMFPLDETPESDPKNEKIREWNNSRRNRLYFNYCANIKNNGGETSGSRIFTNDDCKDWYHKLPKDAPDSSGFSAEYYQENVAEKVCEAHRADDANLSTPASAECTCYDREHYSGYQQLKNELEKDGADVPGFSNMLNTFGSDNCWYNECKSDIEAQQGKFNFMDPQVQCPNMDVCQAITKVIVGKNAMDVSKISQTLSCGSGSDFVSRCENANGEIVGDDQTCQCPANSTKNNEGKCVCNPNWEGKKCDQCIYNTADCTPPSNEPTCGSANNDALFNGKCRTCPQYTTSATPASAPNFCDCNDPDSFRVLDGANFPLACGKCPPHSSLTQGNCECDPSYSKVDGSGATHTDSKLNNGTMPCEYWCRSNWTDGTKRVPDDWKGAICVGAKQNATQKDVGCWDGLGADDGTKGEGLTCTCRRRDDVPFYQPKEGVDWDAWPLRVGTTDTTAVADFECVPAPPSSPPPGSDPNQPPYQTPGPKKKNHNTIIIVSVICVGILLLAGLGALLGHRHQKNRLGAKKSIEYAHEWVDNDDGDFDDDS